MWDGMSVARNAERRRNLAVLRVLNICVMDRPTDRSDLLKMCKDEHKEWCAYKLVSEGSQDPLPYISVWV